MIITHTGQHLELLSEAAVFLKEHSTLILADVHLGKAATFRAHGIAVPDGDSAYDLHRITQLLLKTQAQQLVIAGDLLHSPEGTFPELTEWLSHCPAHVSLVIGNHDQRTLPRLSLDLKTLPSLVMGNLEIIHDPAEASANHFSICGHIHPVIHIKDSQRTSIRSACFHLRENVLTLPSFGTFTGGQVIQPQPNDRFFIPLNDRVVEIPQRQCIFRKK